MFILLFFALSFCKPTLGQDGIIHNDAYNYLEVLKEEQAELDFQLKHQEITLSFYKLASTRLSILRELITNYGRDSQMSSMPEYHVVLSKELETLMYDGLNKLKKAKPNQIIDQKWRFLKTVNIKGNTFYILERLSDGY